MIVYHGSFCEIKEPEIRISTHDKDFGQGFYCTALQEQAERWAKRFQPSIINIYEYKESKT
jgi:hypothetical protein